MNLFKYFKGRNKDTSDGPNDIWDTSLEEIPYGEQIWYKIASKFSSLKSGERFGIENVFGDSFSTDEYLEFIKFISWYSGPVLYQSQAKFETTIAENPLDSHTQKKIANTYIAIGQPEKSTEWYKKAALDGDAEAMTRYMAHYSMGWIPKKISNNRIDYVKKLLQPMVFLMHCLI